ncbi:hypothetical protein [Streptomyces griseocarneus]|uniref:hypothetical protein n=1 Tax=Streptomyces griseocarneus TaxID=51201 RepID=UPI00167E15F4|nr:hypothetical protein [Streptomyces griseocarneus]MBZ6476737.1 hypothetical protein [Streptomyces griseocarneus]GHG80629.1 hypothetical protein GCM10018779_62360 [Streptomyces griseocarneus]
MPPQLLGEEAKGRAGHVDTGRVDKHVTSLVERVLLVKNLSTRGFITSSRQLPPLPSSWKGLTVKKDEDLRMSDTRPKADPQPAELLLEIKVHTKRDGSHGLELRSLPSGLHSITATQLQESGAENVDSGGGYYAPQALHPTGGYISEWVSAVVPGGLTGLIAVLTAFLYRNRGKRFVIRHEEREFEIEDVSVKQAQRLLTEFFSDPQPGTAGLNTVRHTTEPSTPRDTGEAGTAPCLGAEPSPNGKPDLTNPGLADAKEGQE